MIIHEGKKYARVSDILRPFNNFGHIDPSVLENKARLGTDVHKAIEDDISGQFPSPLKGGFGHFKSYLNWCSEIKPHFIRSEERYFNDEKMITGQIDAIAMIPGEKIPTLIDFKTSVSESKEVWPMQAHLYAYLLATNGILVGPRYLFVKLDKTGSLPQVFSYPWDSNIHAKCLMAIDSFWSNETK